jgi:hypothetical protein
MVIVKEEDRPVDVIPQEFAARTLAQEYGGGAFAVDKSVVVFSNYKDQRLYKQAIGSKYQLGCYSLSIEASLN